MAERMQEIGSWYTELDQRMAAISDDLGAKVSAVEAASKDVAATELEAKLAAIEARHVTCPTWLHPRWAVTCAHRMCGHGGTGWDAVRGHRRAEGAGCSEGGGHAGHAGDSERGGQA
eukprot:3933670-Rhodomonas_salina.1